jgi:hypothetical protein
MKFISHKFASVFFILIMPMLLGGIASTQSVPPRAMRCLVGAVAPGSEIELVRVKPGGENVPFIVPAGYSFVLTDVVLSPQLIPVEGWYVWGIVSGPEFTAAIKSQSSAPDLSSFQMHLNTGMVFRSGNRVRFGLSSGPSPLNVYAYGYLIKGIEE